MKALTDSIGLRAPCFCPRVLDVLQVQIKFVFMMLGRPTELRASVGEHAKEWNILCLKK